MYCEAIHCADTRTIRFAIYPDGLDGPRITAHISEAALRGLEDAPLHDDADLAEACEAHFDCIEAKALERYREAPSRPILLEAEDLSACALPH
ncbi:hypothetical protein [Variovorax sp. JS1663]|uniref:hypothetical protein n=1 Tax=Variovorax sp. JS1663 TaxID=1851577 RepID=UPI000B346164|nr:hypothetical protein [Variovorax sp. JS1663]OUM00456.1 hypothetical protein A8M77_20490 [Variovorax sp. JS1663]